MKCWFCLLIFFVVNFTLQAQIADCVGAYPVCGNGEIGFQPDGIGADDFAAPGNNSPTCQFRESQSLWLRFKIKQAGTLGFDLIPEDLTGEDRDDYDFALYGPNVSCSTLGTNIRCSSTNPQQANVQAETGMNQSETDTSEGPGEAGNGYIHWLDNVQVGDTYYLLIDNFDQDEGFRLQWTGTALLEDRITKAEGGVDLGEDVYLCGTESIEIDATTIGGATYLWNTGDTTPILTVDTPGIYSVQVTTESGCFSEDEIEVFLAPNPEITSSNAVLDTQCEPSELLLSATGTEGNFTWFNPAGELVGEGEMISLPQLTNEDSGNYEVVLTNEFSCTDEDTLAVNIYPNYLFEELVQPCPGDVFEVPQTGELVYQSDSIEVNLTTVNGCDSIYFYDVQFYSCGDEACTGFPNAISANADDINDRMIPLFSSGCVPTEFELQIFNRWGEKLFTTTNYLEGWNGLEADQPAQPGFYLWLMNYSFGDGNDFNYSGGVTLLK